MHAYEIIPRLFTGWVYRLVVLVILVFLLTMVMRSVSPTDSPAVDSPLPNCAHYDSQAAAQAAYRHDPRGLVALDGDHDGFACELNDGPYDATPVVRRP